jgi:hypothetical protein
MHRGRKKGRKKGSGTNSAHRKRGQDPIVRSTLWAIWLLGPDPFSDAAEHPSGHLAIGSSPLFRCPLGDSVLPPFSAPQMTRSPDELRVSRPKSNFVQRRQRSACAAGVVAAAATRFTASGVTDAVPGLSTVTAQFVALAIVTGTVGTACARTGTSGTCRRGCCSQ